MLHKSYALAEFKAIDSGPNADFGEFKAIVSAFGNVDHMGDKVMDTAFDDSLKSWVSSGDDIPVVWSHDWGNPFAHIGGIDPRSAKAIPGVGLAVTGRIPFKDEFGNDLPFAKQVYSLMKRRLVKEFSFGYEIMDERPGKDRSNELWKLNLIEAGPTLKGMNPNTELLGVKAELEQASEIGQLKARVAALEKTGVDELKRALIEVLERPTQPAPEVSEAATAAAAEPPPVVATPEPEAVLAPTEPVGGAVDQALRDEVLKLEI